MAVRIRLKKMGRKARPFFRVCAVDSRSPRDGKVIEELGYYNPMIRDTDARVVLKRERVDYWLGVGAQPSQKAGVLIKKYGTNGTHLEKQQAAQERLKSKTRSSLPDSTQPAEVPAQAKSPAAPPPEAKAETESKAPEAESTGSTEEASKEA